MHKIIEQPTSALSRASGPEAEVLRAEAWAGEPFLHNGEDADEALAPGTARRRALDEALAGIDAGRSSPSPEWKVRYASSSGSSACSARSLRISHPAPSSGATRSTPSRGC